MLKQKDSKQSIQVTIRVRPLSEKQQQDGNKICVTLESPQSLKLGLGADCKKFTFDSICFNETQEDIFNRVGRKSTLDCLEGYNCTIFAYGQTGAGKTYTMMGVNFEHELYEEHQGLIPRTMEFLFNCIDRERANGVNFIIRCSFLEIYNEQIIDLLNKSNNNLQLREDTRKGVYVEGITEETISRSEQALQILKIGSKSRHVGSTFYNQTSSRSHSVFTMQIESKYSKNGVVNTKSRQFNFIDLAGSERTKQSTGERLKQGCNINKSLMNLASVINALSQVSQGKLQHVNYRNSKLTFLLKDSLGGNSKTNLIANISPSALFFSETLSTLSFARRAKLIKREKALINQDSTGNLQSMKNQIKRLKQQVITLMSRQQSPQSNCPTQQNPSEMTKIMHHYVEEEIDKQTKLELEILKLNDRIVHLQSGIRQYSSNEVHLRMIITVYEDKIGRLKNLQKILNQKIETSSKNENDTETRSVIDYFRTERESMMKEIDSLRKQAQGTRFLKQLLNEAKIMKDDGEDESLKELLMKNTSFLNEIHSKLQDMKPEKLESESSSQFQQRVASLELEFSQKQEEFKERIQQLNLEMSQYMSRNEENEKLLQEAINGQIALEDRIQVEEQANTDLKTKIERHESMVLEFQKTIDNLTLQNEDITNSFKTQSANKEKQSIILKKEIELLKVKLQKSLSNEAALKEQFDQLEEEKYKLDTMYIQEAKERKNNIVKYQSEISLLSQTVESLKAENSQIEQLLTKAQQLGLEKQKGLRIKFQQIEQSLKAELLSQRKEILRLKQSLLASKQENKVMTDKLSHETKEIEQRYTSQFLQKVSDFNEQLQKKEAKIQQLIIMVNEKEANDSQNSIMLNQVRIELINSQSQKQSIETRYKKSLEELREKAKNDQSHYEHLQKEAIERYETLSEHCQQMQKKLVESNEIITKTTVQLATLQQQILSQAKQMSELTVEFEDIKNKQKNQRLSNIQIKNELSILQQRAEIETDSWRSEINLKNQHIDQLEKELAKYKVRQDQQILELQTQLSKQQQLFLSQEESYKNLIDNLVALKQKKLAETIVQLEEKESLLKNQSVKKSELQQIIEEIANQKIHLTDVIQQKNQQINKMQSKLQQISQDTNLAKQKYQKLIEEAQITHIQQIDEKNDKIQTLQLENESLTKLMEASQQQQQQLVKKNINLSQELAKQIQKDREQTSKFYELSLELERKQSQFTVLIQQKDQQIRQLSKSVQAFSCETENKNLELGKQLAAMAQSLSETHSQNSRFANQLEQQQRTLQQKNNEIISTNNQINLLHSQMETLLQQNNVEKKELQGKINLQSIELNNYQSKQDALKQQSQLLRSQLTVLRVQVEDKKLVQLKNQQLNNQISQLDITIQAQQQSAALMSSTNELLQKQIAACKVNLNYLQNQLSISNSTIEELKLNDQTKLKEIDCLSTKIHELEIQIHYLVGKNQSISQQLVDSDSERMTLQDRHIRDLAEIENLQESQKQIEKTEEQLFNLSQQRKNLVEEVNTLMKTIKQYQIEKGALKEKVSNYEVNYQKTNKELQELLSFKQKWQLQISQMDKMRNTLDQEKLSKERLYNELSRERENQNNLKMLIENKEAQNHQLEIELDEKDSIYKKLVEKIARNENQSKKTTNSQHYLRTIELLEKSRAEQIQLRRHNEDLKKIMQTMKEEIEKKDSYAKQVEKKSQGYCISMHKRLEEIQNDYVELEKSQEKLIKEKKFFEKSAYDNEQLKDEIKNLKNNALKLAQKYQQLQNRFKKSNLDYIQLEKQLEEYKKGQQMMISSSADQKTAYINRLKAEVAALKTQKVLLSETLNKEREEKTKLKADIRYGKDTNAQIGMKYQLEKKTSQFKSLNDLINEIVSKLDIHFNEPKLKLENIRTSVLGAIKGKDNQIKILKEKLKQNECETQRQTALKSEYSNFRQNRELKALSISNANKAKEEQTYRFEKDKDPSFLNNNSRQKMKEFENYYARLRQTEEQPRRN